MYVAIVNLREKCAGNYKAFRIGRDFWHAAISGPVPGRQSYFSSPRRDALTGKCVPAIKFEQQNGILQRRSRAQKLRSKKAD